MPSLYIGQLLRHLPQARTPSSGGTDGPVVPHGRLLLRVGAERPELRRGRRAVAEALGRFGAEVSIFIYF